MSCAEKTEMTRPWLNEKLSADKRAGLLLAAMTVQEKVAQMIQISYSITPPEMADEWARRGAGSFLHTLGNDARRIQRIATETRLGIPIIFGIDAIHGHAIHNGATVFPTQLALAAGWNPEIAEKMGRITALQVAAEGLHWTFSPVFCLGRDLRWGRIDETFGEDPYLTGQLGAAVIRGYQGNDLKSPDSIAACAKHYIAYGESTGGRDSYDASVSMRTIRTTFLPPFAEAVQAGCLTFMTGYETIDGVPCTAHTRLLRGILKEELGFDGFVVTDWANVASLIERQKITTNMEEAAKIAVEAGNDMIMSTPEFYDAVLSLIDNGKMSEEQIDEAVLRILKLKFKIGLFDAGTTKVKTANIEDDPDTQAAEELFNCPAYQEASLNSARKTMVLLKNENVGGHPALPIYGPKFNGISDGGKAGTNAEAQDKGQTGGRLVKTIAVVGPNADSVRAQVGDWTFFTHPLPHYDAVPNFHITTMLDGITDMAKTHGIQVLYDKGCDISDPEKETIDAACTIASRADIVCVAVGDTIMQTGEAHDRADLALSGAQNELVRALRKICTKNGTPLVSILVNGKPLEFDVVAKASDAVLETFNSGTLGGRAAAEILFGFVNPSGRLPISFPRKTGQLPVYYNQLPGWHDGKYYDCDPTPLFAFGEGLSYTEFRYDAVSLSQDTACPGETIQVSVTVTNTGSRAGTETIQVYAADRVASVLTPIRQLKAFRQIDIPAGKTVSVAIPLAIDSLSIVTPDEKYIVEPGEFEIQVGHDSRQASLKTVVLTVI